MGRKIYLIDNNRSLQPLEEQPYDSEDLLQRLLASYPDLLTDEGDQGWLLIDREHAVPAEEGGSGRWSLDHLFLDSDGIPTLVEVKRSTDTRLRREVVGQMLDYAANGVAWWPIQQIQEAFTKRCERENLDPEYELSQILTEGKTPERYWQQVNTNLQAGRIRMVFVADAIPPELRRIVEFLNEQMSMSEVLAVEVRQFIGDGIKTLIPEVIGRTGEAERVKKVGVLRKTLTEDELLAQIGEIEERQTIRNLLEIVHSSGGIVFMGSKGVSLRVQTDLRHTPVSIGWYFPPGVNGWYSIKDLVLGYEPGSTVPFHDELLGILDAYAKRISRMRGAVDFPREGICGSRFQTNEIPRIGKELNDEVRRVIRELKSAGHSS